MSTYAVAAMRPLAAGILLSLLSIIFGFLLGGAFGAAEDPIKRHLRGSAEAVFETAYQGDAARLDAVVSKSWAYLKRAHLHGGGIGAAALASILLLALLGSPGALERVSAAAFGAGALVYSIFWLVAGLMAPSVGSTGEAKEALEFLAIPGAALCLIGISGTLISAVKHLVMRPGDSG